MDQNPFDVLAAKAKLPPVTLHGLRHGAATMLLAAGQPPKVISEVLGRSTVSFTMDVYTEVAEELADTAASAIAAYVPRMGKIISGGAISVCQMEAGMITETKTAVVPVWRSGWSLAEARGFEPRMGANPNRISSAAP